MMSWRGSRPKISSESWTEPAALPSRVVTFSSISRALRLGRRFRNLLAAHDLELAGLRRFLRQRLLHGVTHRDPAALGAGNGAFDQDQAALNVGLHHAQIERGDAVDAHMAGHLLVLPGLAGVLTAAGRTDRTVRDRHAVGGAQAAEIPALHAAGKALADRGAGDIDKLADHEMVGLDFSPHRNQRVLRDAELRDLALRLDLGDRDLAAFGLRQIDGLAGAGPELQRDMTVRLGRAVAQHLAIAQLQHGHGDMLAGLRKDPRHPDLLCDHSGAHRCASCSFCPEGLANLQCEHDPIRKPAPTFGQAQSLISTSKPAARSSFISASTVCGVGSTISSRRLCVRISNCSRLFLSMWGERLTVNFSILVGSGIGPRTCAPVRLAVATISRVDASRMR